MTPSRSAHGQISSSGEVEDVHHRRGDERAGDDLVGAARWRPRAARAISSRLIVDELGDPLVEVGGGQDAAYEQALARGCGAADPRQRAERLRGGDGVVGRAAAQQRCRRRGRSRCGSACAACASASRRACPSREVLAGQPAGAERQRPGDVRRLVAAAGDLERAAADVEDGQPARGPAEPAAYGEERQPRLVLTGQHLDLARRCGPRHGPARRRSCRRRGPPRWRRSRSPRSPCPRPAVSALPTKAVRASTPFSVTSPSGLEVLGQPELLLVGGRRHRRRAAVGVDDEQVARVGADVEHTEAHAPHGRSGRPRFDRRRLGFRSCPRSISSFPVPGSSSRTRPTPTRCSAAT